MSRLFHGAFMTATLTPKRPTAEPLVGVSGFNFVHSRPWFESAQPVCVHLCCLLCCIATTLTSITTARIELTPFPYVCVHCVLFSSKSGRLRFFLVTLSSDIDSAVSADCCRSLWDTHFNGLPVRFGKFIHSLCLSFICSFVRCIHYLWRPQSPSPVVPVRQ